MSTTTIPQKKSRDVVTIPRKEYEELLSFKKYIPVYKPTQSEIRAVKQGRKDFADGKYISWRELKNELASLRSRTGKKEN